MHVLDNKGEVWKTFIVMVPTLGASLIATTRIMDARHHPFDVISGSLIGILVAWGSYRQYFPAVTDAWRKGRAYPIRSWGTEPTGPSDNPGFTRINESKEPIRAMDEEELRGREPMGVGLGAGETGAGVFRQPSSTYPGSTYPGSTYPARERSMSPIENPFTETSNPYTRRVNIRDGNWSSSSSEDGDHEGGYPMQTYGRPAYGRPGPEAAPVGEEPMTVGGSAYDQVDTGYPPQAPAPLQLNPKSYATRGDGSSVGSPPPPLPTGQQQQEQSSYSPVVEGYERTETVTHPLRTA